MKRHRASILVSILSVAAFSLIAAGCGGGGAPGVASIGPSTAPNAAGSSATASRAGVLLLAGRCLREHGLANLPDPTVASAGPAKGKAILDKLALHAFPAPMVDNALAACRSVLQRAGIGSGSRTRTLQEIQDGLAFARCVRRHGISNFPDPDAQGTFNLAGTGINPHSLSRAQLAAATTCLRIAHGVIKIPSQANNASNGS